MVDQIELPEDLAVANDDGGRLLRVYHARGRMDLPNPRFSDPCDTVDLVHAEAKRPVICLTFEPDEALRLLEPHLALLTEPADSYRRLYDGTIAISLELACQGRLIVALTQCHRSFVTWAAFERLDDINYRDIRENGSAAAPGFGKRGVTAWELESHILHEPHLVNRLFPIETGFGRYETNAESLARRLRESFRTHINPYLHNPFVFPDELERPDGLRWKEMTAEDAQAALTTLAIAVTGGTARGRIEISAAISDAALPMADVVFESHAGSDSDAALSKAELNLLLECLLIEWEPRGNDLGLVDVRPYDQGIRRAAFLDQACQIDIPIEEASAHELIAATEKARPMLLRIAATKPWTKDPWYGRRTGAALEDAEALLLGLMRRLS